MPNPPTRPLERGLLFTSGDILLLGISDDAAVQLRDGRILRGLNGCRFDPHHFRLPDYIDGLWRGTAARNIPPGAMCAIGGNYFWKLQDNQHGLTPSLTTTYFVEQTGTIMSFDESLVIRTSAWRLVRQHG